MRHFNNIQKGHCLHMLRDRKYNMLKAFLKRRFYQYFKSILP